MKRRHISGTTNWFNEDTAERFYGDHDHSAIRGTDLFLTSRGKWIFYNWSRAEGSTYELTDQFKAVEWLQENDHFDVLEKHFPGQLKENEV